MSIPICSKYRHYNNQEKWNLTYDLMRAMRVMSWCTLKSKPEDVWKQASSLEEKIKDKAIGENGTLIRLKMQLQQHRKVVTCE
jgi:hypothetical protein